MFLNNSRRIWFVNYWRKLLQKYFKLVRRNFSFTSFDCSLESLTNSNPHFINQLLRNWVSHLGRWKPEVARRKMTEYHDDGVVDGKTKTAKGRQVIFYASPRMLKDHQYLNKSRIWKKKIVQTFVNSRFLVALEVHSIIAQKVPPACYVTTDFIMKKYLQKFGSAI